MSRVKINQRYAILNRNRVRRFRSKRKATNNTRRSLEEEGLNDSYLNISLNELQDGKPLLDLLRAWVNCFRISMRAVNALLKILIGAGLRDLPRDYRSLLHTPRALSMSSVAGGQLWYNGISKNLQMIFSKLDHDLTIGLKFNMDGLPIFKSSQREFWPILSSIHKMPHIQPMIVAIWFGTKKPTDYNEYLQPFVSELKEILANGVVVNGHLITVLFHCCVCDSPARAYIKGTVSYNHTFGCQKCMIEGIHSKVFNRVSYPRTDVPLRTDNNFRTRAQPDHHKENSILEELPIDMVKSFPTSDPLHLLDLGVMKKCLLLWLHGDNEYKGNWPKDEIPKINSSLRRFNQYKPMEIHRAVRDLKDLHFWKGTEFRSFLLYYGIVLLKDHLVTEEYEHFLLLSSAVRIFSVDTYTRYREIARDYLTRYIEGFINIFGLYSISSNVHLLCHVFEDVQHLGCLNEISTYPFENRLNFLKMRIKQPNLPLAQIARRVVELSTDYDMLFGVSTVYQTNTELKYPYKLGNRLVYKTIIVKSGLTLSTQKHCNRWFLTNNDDVVRMEYACLVDKEVTICGTPLMHKDKFFKRPFSSDRLQIFKSDGETDNASFYKLNTIKAKMMYLPCSQTEFVFIPLLHTMN